MDYPTKMLETFFSKLEWLGPKPNTISLETIPRGTCIIWGGQVRPDGYGLVNIPRPLRADFGGRANVRAHRMAFEIFHKASIPDGLVIRHSCDIPPCCNPHHLLVGTYQDSSTDAVTRGRHAHGRSHGCVKLSEGTAREIIRRIYKGQAGSDIADKFKVSKQLITAIRKGRAWSHLLGIQGLPTLEQLKFPQGKSQPACRFTVEQVQDIRRRFHAGVDLNVIAAEHHLTRRTLYRIATKRRYPNVPDA